ncbi:hypothetical protein ABE087_16110 [Niallia taxi]
MTNKYGINVTILKPHLMLPNFGDWINRAEYSPTDTAVFFSRWQSILLYYANICDKYGIPILSLSSETMKLTDEKYYYQWESIVMKIKKKYPDLKLTIAFNMNEFNRELQYFEQNKKSVSEILEYTSLNMYPNILRSRTNGKTIERDNFHEFINSIKKAKEYFGKDILITETGATARSDNSKDYITAIVLDTTKPSDHLDQNQWTKIVLRQLLNINEVKGVYLWHVDYPFNFFDSSTFETVHEIYSES